MDEQKLDQTFKQAKPDLPAVSTMTKAEAKSRSDVIEARKKGLNERFDNRIEELQAELKRIQGVRSRYEHDLLKSGSPLWTKAIEAEVDTELIGPDAPMLNQQTPVMIAKLPEMILSSAETEISHQEFKISPIDLKQAVVDFGAFFSLAFKGFDNKRMHIFIDPKLKDAQVMGIAEKVIPAIYNMLNNSRRIINDKGEGDMSIAVSQGEDGSTVLEVSDNLGGYSNEMKATTDVTVGERVLPKAAAFEKGVSGSGSTGIGLATVWETFVEGVGAEATVINRPFQYLDEKSGEKIDTGIMDAVTSIKFPPAQKPI